MPGRVLQLKSALNGAERFRADAAEAALSSRRGVKAMAGSVNKVILVGNLGKDPEIRRTQDGRPIANLRIATSESWRDKNTGERREKTEWHSVVIFNENLCKVAEQYLRRARRSTSRARCRRANGRTSRARTATRPRSCCRASTASSPCSTAAPGGRRHAGGRAVRLRRRRELGRRLQRARRAARAAQQRRWWRLEAASFDKPLDDEIPF